MNNLIEAQKPQTAVRAKTKVLLVEDHPLFRAGLRQTIQSEDDFEVVGEVDSAPHTLHRLRGAPVDLVVIDISLRGTDGIELIKSVRAEHKQLPILVLSMHDEGVYAMRALRAGANGYLMKREGVESILGALRTIMAGEIAVSAGFKDHLLYRVLRGESSGQPNPIEALSDRELEVLQLVGQGLSSRLISERLNLSPKTVESHRLHIKEKLRLQHAAELVRFAVDWVNQQSLSTAGEEVSEEPPPVG